LGKRSLTQFGIDHLQFAVAPEDQFSIRRQGGSARIELGKMCAPTDISTGQQSTRVRPGRHHVLQLDDVDGTGGKERDVAIGWPSFELRAVLGDLSDLEYAIALLTEKPRLARGRHVAPGARLGSPRDLTGIEGQANRQPIPLE
jgi:hypothetical protein